MKIIVIAAVVCFLFLQNSVAQTLASINGKVVEATSEEPLQGVSLKIASLNIFAETNLNGEFILKNIPVGSYTLQIQLKVTKRKIFPSTFSKINPTI